MKILGFHVPFTAKATDLNTVTPIRDPFRLSSSWGTITEAFAGMWQTNVVIDNTQSQLAFSAVYACVTLIAGDIAKLRLKLLRRQGNFWPELTEGDQSPYLRVLYRPNRYQTRYQFVEAWMLSKLIWGNTYALKERDARGVVVALYVLNPQSVTPLVAPDGEIFYQLGADRLAGLQETPRIAVPMNEIIHDRGPCLFHPLIGIPPLYAAGMSSTQGRRIQTNSSQFFQNMSRPSGQLTAPGSISDATAQRLKESFEANFSGVNVGRLLVAGDGLKFEPFTMPPEQAQLIEQLKYTVEDAARPFHVPLYKIGAGAVPALGSVAALNQEYYQQALQPHMEQMEGLLDVGLELPSDLDVKFDVDGLLRLDPKSRMEAFQLGVGAGVLKPNEARASEGRAPVEGGDTCYLQQQNFSLAALAKRDAQEDPFGSATAPPAPPKPPEAEDEDDDEEAMEEARALLAEISKGLECAPNS